jgi:hypothetical protein
MENAVVCSDLELIVAFHENFLFPHFNFFQNGDPNTGNTPSFIAHHVAVRYCTMHTELKAMENGGWRNHKGFKSFVESIGKLNGDDIIIQEKTSTSFFNMFVTHYQSTSILGQMVTLCFTVYF